MSTTTSDLEIKAHARFTADTSEHRMTVLHDDGLYRHLRFSAPGTYTYGFDLITWPGFLAIAGDMGERVFSRVSDMFEFFESNTGRINPEYWGEKVRPGGTLSVQEYSEEAYRSRVREWLADQTKELGADLPPDEREPDDIRKVEELKTAAEEQLLGHFEPPFDRRDAVECLMNFEHAGITISEPYEWDLTVFDNLFLWQCWAIVWGIEQYRRKEREMSGALTEDHLLDKDGKPAGGTTVARGIRIEWQNGPLGRGDDRDEPNGTFVEGVIQAAKGRLEFYQSGQFACQENAEAITHLEAALDACRRRTAGREARGVEGTHAP